MVNLKESVKKNARSFIWSADDELKDERGWGLTYDDAITRMLKFLKGEQSES